MPRHVTAVPLWSDRPDPRLDLGKLAHIAPGTTERILADMKADQAARIQEIEREFNPIPHTMDRYRRRPTPRPTPATTSYVHSTAPAQPAVAAAVCLADDVLAGVHPLAAADARRRCQGDLRRIEVLSPTRVMVHNRPWQE